MSTRFPCDTHIYHNTCKEDGTHVFQTDVRFFEGEDHNPISLEHSWIVNVHAQQNNQTQQIATNDLTEEAHPI